MVAIAILVAAGQELGDAANDLAGERSDIASRGWVEPAKPWNAGFIHHEHAIGQDRVEMPIEIAETAKTLHEADGAASEA